MKNAGRFASACLLLIIVFAALFAPVVTGHDPLAQNADIRLAPPSRVHLLGTDGFGRDVFSRTLHGARISLYVGLSSVGIATCIGVTLGMIAAYTGGVVDWLVGRIVDIFLGFPYLVLAILIIVVLESSATAVALSLAAVFTPRITRLTRASALSLLEEPFIEAARMIGAGPVRILFRHLLPNLTRSISVHLSGNFGTAIATEAILSYLGLGVPPPNPSWGRMIQEGTRLYIEVAPWLVLGPGAALIISVLCFAVLARID